jgi:hypothetical protein
MDFCPGNAATAAEWEAALAPRADGTVGRMDEPLHTHRMQQRAEVSASAAGAAAAAAPAPPLPLGQRQRWCNVDSAMMTWLAQPSVVAALFPAGPPPKGTEQNNLDYSRGGADDLTPLYAALAKKYRMWIYNGQEDGCVPYNIMEEFTAGLGFPQTKAWHPWAGADGAGGARVAAGYATQYGGDSSDLAFVTVKGAGHEVPSYMPTAAFDLFGAFLQGAAL